MATIKVAALVRSSFRLPLNSIINDLKSGGTHTQQNAPTNRMPFLKTCLETCLEWRLIEFRCLEELTESSCFLTAMYVNDMHTTMIIT